MTRLGAQVFITLRFIQECSNSSQHLISPTRPSGSTLLFLSPRGHKMASETLQLLLTTDMGYDIDPQCPQCLYMHDNSVSPCPQRRARRNKKSRSFKSNPRYQTREPSKAQLQPNTIAVQVIADQPRGRALLRHKALTHDKSLRELRDDGLPAKRSEAQLQKAYEAQILVYFESPLADPEHFIA